MGDEDVGLFSGDLYVTLLIDQGSRSRSSAALALLCLVVAHIGDGTLKYR